MKCSTRHLWLAGSAFVALLAMTGTSFAQSQENLDRRLTLVEHKLDNAALGEMANQMETLRQQIQTLRGENEQLQRQLQKIKERQRNIYSDVDSRLRELEQGTATPSSSSSESHSSPTSSATSQKADKKAAEGENTLSGNAVSGNASPDGSGGTAQKKNQTGGKVTAQSELPANSTGEHEAYEQAFNTLKEGRYAKSQQEFNELLQHYPQGRYADNARYWLGESYYAQGQFDQAMGQFQKVLDDFPHSAKRPGAQLKIGFIQFEQGKLDQARKTLGEVIQSYPNSTAANLAQQRLRLIDSSQQQ